MADALLARLSYDPGRQDLASIPWPKGLAPSPFPAGHASPSAPLPRADVLVVTWTAAESRAMADVLTPGVHITEWAHYAEHWDEYLPLLTGRSPAKFSRCMANYHLTDIGSKRVLCVKSNLHLATDGTTAPVVKLWKQMVAEVQPKLVITTGTAGGIGETTVLGDVFVVNAAKFNCTKAFKDKPWAQQRFAQSGGLSIGPNVSLANDHLIPANAGRLPSDLTPHAPSIWASTGDVETVDYFAFADTDDSFGVIANDPQAHTEEMDDATLPLALSQLGSSIPWLSIRNASDPEVPSSIGDISAQKRWAAKIYEKYGYWTTVGSAIACWAAIADLNP
ncbi:MAG TPA: hypothetical protein VFG00_12445 [Acidothermaceae bacterium]|nr:hypothetical protein [Acidothermaceae bacterium]